MTTVQQKLPAAGVNGGNGSGSSCEVSEADTDRFPAGLRVLVVDDDRTCLKMLEQMLRKCLYHVTTCYRATVALSLLRENKDGFDLVISDVHMPDMDGFKLLEHVGLEMDLPVIMMSADGRTSAVSTGIRHGACDYLIKPVRMEELKNIWQHVLRKKLNENKEHENSGSVEDSDRQKRGVDDTEYASVNDGTDGSLKGHKKKRECKDDEDDSVLDNDDPSTSKKPRVVWSVELHQQFVSAVNQLGIDKAVPKRILELMNVPGLTRENVASHLQKFRLYLKRLSGVSQHQNGHPNTYCGPGETGAKVNPLGRLDFQALAASGQIPPHSLAAALHAELLGRPSGTMVLSGLDQSSLLQASVPGSKYTSVEHGVGYGSQPVVKCSSNMGKQFPQSNIVLEDAPSGLLDWSTKSLGTACSTNNLGGMNSLHNNNMLAHMQPQKPPQPVISESSHAVNVQPSYLIIPSQSSGTYQVGNTLANINLNPLLAPNQPSNSYQSVNSPAQLNQNPGFGNRSATVDYSLASSQPCSSSLCAGPISDGHFKNSGFLTGFSVAGSTSSPMSSADGNTTWRLPISVVDTTTSGSLSGLPPILGDIQASGASTGMFSNQGQVKNLGFVGKGTCIPSRFAVDDIESLTDNPCKKNIVDSASGVKQEIELDFSEGSTSGNGSHYSASDFMSVISK